MEPKRHKVVYNIGGITVPLSVPEEEESLFIKAREMLHDRLAVLKNKYALKANIDQLLITLAIETLVDSLKVNNNYIKLKDELEQRIDSINISLLD